MKNHNFVGNLADMRAGYLYCFLVFMVFSACTRQNQLPDSSDAEVSTIITGKIAGGNGTLVTLDRMGKNAFESVDSVRCNRDGSFQMEWSQEGLEFYALKYTEQGYVTLATMPGDHLVFSGNDTSAYPYSVNGSQASHLISELAMEHKKTLEKLTKISVESNEIIGRNDYVSLKKDLNKKFDSITNSFAGFSRSFIRQNAGSPSTLIALYNLYGPNLPVFDPSVDLDVYREVDSALYLQFPDNEAVSALHYDLQATLEQLRLQNQAESLQPGSRAPDFVISGLNGESITLSEFKGKYVLLNFWASWSKPSVDQQAVILDCRKSFDENQLIILQVSLDDEMEKWKSSISGNQPGLIHASELERWESLVSRLYKLERIPANFLIDRDGIIIEKDIFGPEMKRVLLSIMES